MAKERETQPGFGVMTEAAKSLGYADESTESKVTRALSAYIADISEIGFIQKVFLGLHQTDRKAYVFNVFQTEVRLQDTSAPDYVTLTHLATVLQRQLAPEVSARVAYVNPSKLARLRQDCKTRNILLLSPIKIPH